MLRRSLWARIVLAQIVTAIILAIGLPVLSGRALSTISDDLTARFLGDQALRALSQPGAARWPSASPAVAIYLERHGEVTRLSGPAIDDVSALPAPTRQAGLIHGPHSDFYVVPASTPGSWLIAAQDRRHPSALLDDITRMFLRRFWVIVPLMLVLSTLASLLAVRTAMRPLRAAAHSASTRNPANMNLRLDASRVPTEVVPLIEAANGAFDRLEQAFERERAFSSTVVHELRTGLSTILLRTEQLAPGPIRSALQEAVTRGAGVIDQMLELQAVSKTTGATIVCLEEVAEQVCQELLPLAEAAGRTLTVEIVGHPPAFVRAPRSLTVVVLRNLVQNANLHSTPEQPIAIICDNWTGSLGVRDHGPGVVARQDADGRMIYSRADGVPSLSSGLGLAIVHRLMGTIEGKLSYEQTEQGGTLATLHFLPLVS